MNELVGESVGTPGAEPIITVGLLWHSLSSENLGVGALTDSQMRICNDAAARAGVTVRFVVHGSPGRHPYTIDNASVKVGSRVSIREILQGRSAFLRELDDCDMVLDIGEGDSFTDIYGLKRYIFLIASKVAVIAKGKPLILSPQTIGPFNRWHTRCIAAAVLRRSRRVFARDPLSFEYLRGLGIGENAGEAIDIAFRLPFRRIQRPSSKVLIGLNVSGLLFSGGYTGRNQFDLSIDYAELVREQLRQWTANPNYDVWLIPHVLPDHLPRDDDRVAIRQLAAEFPSAHCAPHFQSPVDAKSFIAAMDFVTGARMHACIAAFSSGVPVVPVAYSRKFNGLFSSLGYEWLVDGRSMSNEQALSMTNEALARRHDLARDVERGCVVAAAKLSAYIDYIAGELSRHRDSSATVQKR